MNPLVLGLDLGTSEAKAGLFDLRGRPFGVARRPYPTETDATGRAEQDPLTWWRSLAACVRDLSPEPRAVAAIGVVGHGPTVALLDADGAPVRPAITWRDRRIEGSGGFGFLPRLAWLAGHEPESLDRARWWFSTWDALGFWLTGTAGLSLQGHEQPIDAEAFRAGGLDPGLMPPAVAMGSLLGGLGHAAATDLGLRAGTPVVAGTNDGTGSLLGAGLLEPGDAVDTGGSSGGFAVYWDRAFGIPGVFEAPAPIPGRHVLGGAMSSTGAALGWLREHILGGSSSFDELVGEAATVPPGAGGLVFLPYLVGERAPIFDDAARGAFVGLTIEHGRAHLARAVLEAAGFAIRHVAEAICAAGVTVTELRVADRDGNGVRARIKADTTGFPVGILRVADTAALGAGILAAVGAGAVADIAEAVRSMPAVEERLAPDPSKRALYEDLFGVYRGLYPALRPFQPALARAARPDAVPSLRRGA